MSNAISIIPLFSAQAIGNGASVNYDLDLDRFDPDGFFSLHFVFTITAGGTLEATYKLSNYKDGSNMVTPASVSEIATDLAAGTYMYSIDPMLSRWIRITFSEDSAGAGTISSLTAKLAMQ